MSSYSAFTTPAALPGQSVLLYDYTVAGSDKATIDTGVDTPDAGIAGIAAFPTGYRILEIYSYLEIDQSANTTVRYTLNNLTTSIYDFQRISGSDVTATISTSLAAANWGLGCHGTGGTSGNVTTHQFVFPNYVGTTFNKTGSVIVCTPDGTAASNQILTAALGFRSTSAISRLKVDATSTFKFKVGSRLMIFAR